MPFGGRKTELMRRLLFVALLWFLALPMLAQDTTAVKNAVDRFERALVEKNAEEVKKLTSPHLRFGHSNGWVQDKEAVLRDMEQGVLLYESFRQESLQIEQSGKLAYVKERVEVKGVARGTDFTIKLFVLQQWIRTKQGWKLQMRQSAKLS